MSHNYFGRKLPFHPDSMRVYVEGWKPHILIMIMIMTRILDWAKGKLSHFCRDGGLSVSTI